MIRVDLAQHCTTAAGTSVALAACWFAFPHAIPTHIKKPVTAPSASPCRAIIGRMRALLKFLVFLVILAAIVLAGAWLWAGRMAGPAIDVRQPGKFIGQATSLEMRAESPDGRFSRLDVTVEQNGKSFPVFTLDQPKDASVKRESAQRLYVMRPVGKKAIPELQNGSARIVIHAARPVVYGIRQVETTVTRDVQVRLQPPQVAVLSTFH